ncbi:hypothetical protein DPMN_186537 [Dreissena polymorpha]|uniref:Uncharacterized protein n=1 Tax=Dreissena polymorpha TaxID=45954 RepID=A0A9D4I891_DREPO|nr:hypothetical protein DPMN_186537 [Dreissena polymorpha]
MVNSTTSTRAHLTLNGKIMVNSTTSTRAHLILNGEKLEEVTSFKNFVATLPKDCTTAA